MNLLILDDSSERKILNKTLSSSENKFEHLLKD